LKVLPLNIHTAHHGKEALDAISSHNYSLILMDVHMPEMDGIEATKKIRQLEHGTTQHVPIIGVSSSIDNKAPGLNAGMDDFILKPADYRRIAKRWLTSPV
jgi:CheY-like chemotaxis protein